VIQVVILFEPKPLKLEAVRCLMGVVVTKPSRGMPIYEYSCQDCGTKFEKA